MATAHKEINAVTITLRTVECLVAMEGGRMTDVAESLDVAPSTAYNHLQTLLNEGYLVRDGDHYYPSMEFLRIGDYARRRSASYRKARTQVEALAEESGGRTHFTIVEHGRGRYVYTSTGNLAVETFSSIGSSFPLHVTSAGKAILADLPDAQVLEIVDQHGLEQPTSNSIGDEDALFEELETIRDRGIAFNIEEHNPGVSAVGATVKEPDGSLLGALSISGPAQRFKGKTIQETLPDSLLAAVNELELEMVYAD